ncbi:unnamed protein product [Prunus armeniaca]
MPYIFQQPKEENRESTTAQTLNSFPQDITLHQNDWSPVKSNRSPPFVLQIQRTFFTTTGRQRKTIGYLHAVKIRRRKLNCFMRFCPLQLQYHTNHLLRKSFRHKAYISASIKEEPWRTFSTI